MITLVLDRPWLRAGLPPGMRALSHAPVGAGYVMARAVLWREVRNTDLTPGFDAERWFAAEVADQAQLSAALNGLHGQLTATIIGEPADFQAFAELTPLLEQKVGRILLNGYPTGVEVCDSMVHGGPYPATSDARGTSVGTLAIDRFLRPVCFQNYPDSLLPEPLKNANPLRIQRLVDGKPSREAL